MIQFLIDMPFLCANQKTKGASCLTKTYVAVDLGASGGRLMVGSRIDNRIEIQQAYRFANHMIQKDDHFYWDVDLIFKEMIHGLQLVSVSNQNITSMGIDSWAVDYVLIDAYGKRVAPVFAYRDHRTDDTMQRVFALMSPKDIYQKTGIAFMQFNTIYQLYEHARSNGQINETTLLFIPDYLNYLLTGKKYIEYTNATATQLLNAAMRDWDDDLLACIGVDKGVFAQWIEPGTMIGQISQEVEQKTGLTNVKVIAPATHDTASAIVSMPADAVGFAYISSGTWSLMGIETDTPICSTQAREYNFTNEGGAFGTTNFLKNVMGMWLIQEVGRAFEGKYSFEDFATLAQSSAPFACLIDPGDQRFLNPDDMIQEIQRFCRQTDQYVPQTPGEIARCIYESLAFSYKQVLIQLREITQQQVPCIHIIGGGSQNKMLNQLCADFTGCDVYAGPIEASALGNIVVQMISDGTIKDIREAREIIRVSFEITQYNPVGGEAIHQNWDKFCKLQHIDRARDLRDLDTM